jgi:TIR domain-containing protein
LSASDDKKRPVRVFVSYVTEDSQIAQELSEGLRRQGINATTADNLIKPGDHVAQVVQEEINKSDAVLLLFSRSSAKSSWLTAEAAMAVAAQERSVSKLIVPVLLDDDPSILPIPLHQYRWLPFITPDERKTGLVELASRLRDLSRGPLTDKTRRNDDVVVSLRLAESELIRTEEFFAALERTRERVFTRFLLGGGIASLLAIVGAAIVLSLRGKSAAEFLQPAITALTGLFGATTGFYFGLRSAKTRAERGNNRRRSGGSAG